MELLIYFFTIFKIPAENGREKKVPDQKRAFTQACGKVRGF